jgi:hypothetical protein
LGTTPDVPYSAPHLLGLKRIYDRNAYIAPVYKLDAVIERDVKHRLIENKPDGQ